MAPLVDPEFWRGRTVLVTGHTGFKGAWLSLWLRALGARVVGLADSVPTSPSLYELARVAGGLTAVVADIRDAATLHSAFIGHEHEVVIHMRRSPSCAARFCSRGRPTRSTCSARSTCWRRFAPRPR